MKYAAGVIAILAMVVVGVVTYELATGNSAIQAKPEQQSNNNTSNNYLAKPDVQTVIKANDGAQKTFIVTQASFTGIQSNLIVSSSDTNSPVNATLDNIANFLVAHSGPPQTHDSPSTKSSVT